MIFFAAVAMILSSCSKNLIPYTVGIEKKISGQETAVQYFTSADMTFTLIDSQDTLVVNQKGEIEKQKSAESKTFFVKAGTRGVLEKKEEGIYWVRFDPNDDRLVPFAPQEYAPNVFTLTFLQGSKSTVPLSDDKDYLFRGSTSQLKVSEKVISKMTQEAKKAKGVKVGK